LLAYFRSLQRQFDLSILLLLHHSRKNAAGQGLRGSGDIHVFRDSNLYLRRTRERLALSSIGAALSGVIATNAETTRLEVIAELEDGSTKLTVEGKRRSLEEHVLDRLPQGLMVTRAKLRDSLGVRNERLGEALETLEEPAVFAARPLVGDARTDRPGRVVPIPHRE
jgi:hypothetical protein